MGMVMKCLGLGKKRKQLSLDDLLENHELMQCIEDTLGIDALKRTDDANAQIGKNTHYAEEAKQKLNTLIQNAYDEKRILNEPDDMVTIYRYIIIRIDEHDITKSTITQVDQLDRRRLPSEPEPELELDPELNPGWNTIILGALMIACVLLSTFLCYKLLHRRSNKPSEPNLPEAFVK